MAAILLPRMSISYIPMQLMYCLERAMSSAVSLPASLAPRAPAGRGRCSCAMAAAASSLRYATTRSAAASEL